MAITSYVEEEGPANGRGHYQHGNGKGLGHLKHQEEAMSDGIYTLRVSGIDVDNPSTTNQTDSAALADESTLSTEVRQGEIAITEAPDGSDALYLQTDSNNGRLRLNVTLDDDQQVTLGDLDELSFDYYIASSDRPDVIPVIRLAIDADGDLTTLGDRGELVFEYAYQGLGATTQDAWQSVDLVGGDWVAWQRSFGVNRDEIVNMTEFSDWSDADGFTPAGGLTFDADSVILGWSLALGSGNGTAEMYVKDLTFDGVTYNFVA